MPFLRSWAFWASRVPTNSMISPRPQVFLMSSPRQRPPGNCPCRLTDAVAVWRIESCVTRFALEAASLSMAVWFSVFGADGDARHAAVIRSCTNLFLFLRGSLGRILNSTSQPSSFGCLVGACLGDFPEVRGVVGHEGDGNLALARASAGSAALLLLAAASAENHGCYQKTHPKRTHRSSSQVKVAPHRSVSCSANPAPVQSAGTQWLLGQITHAEHPRLDSALLYAAIIAAALPATGVLPVFSSY